MKVLTKEVLATFIADSDKTYIAGKLTNKVEDVSVYAEFIRKPMIQKKHKVELLYCTMNEIQDGQTEENVSLYHDELSFIGYIVDSKTVYPFDAEQENTEYLRLFGFDAECLPENLREMMKDELEEYIRSKYIPTDTSIALFFAERPEQEIKDMTLIAAQTFVTGEDADMVWRFIASANLRDEAAIAFWLADKDNWVEPLLRMRKYRNSYDTTVNDKNMKEAVVREKVIERIRTDSIESNEKYLRLKKLIELIKGCDDVELLIKRQTIEGEETLVVHCDAFFLKYINTFEQDGLYLRDGRLWRNPSSEPFISMQDTISFVPLANICGVLLPSGIVYL